MQVEGSNQLRNIDEMSSVDQCSCLLSLSRRPFHVEPRNIVEDSTQERVSAEASVLNSRVHYYGRLAASSDRLLVIYVPSILSIKLHTPTNDFTKIVWLLCFIEYVFT